MQLNAFHPADTASCVRRGARVRMLWCGLLIALAGAATAPAATCVDALGARSRASDQVLTLRGNAQVRVDLPSSTPPVTLIYAIEQGVDVELEARDTAGAIVLRADNPVARSGIQRVALSDRGKSVAWLVVRGREHAGLEGTVRLRFANATEFTEPVCRQVEIALAQADNTYALAKGVASGIAASASSRELLASADTQYLRAAALARGGGRRGDLGAIQLTLAALHYYDLQDWNESAEWAERATDTLRSDGAEYARARAQAILAAAWLEIATKSSASNRSSAAPTQSHALLDKARALLAELERFHAARNEPYDRALQTNNIGLAWFYEARFEPALKYFKQALADFEALGEAQRVAVALQNAALCEWGLGRLTAALPMFDRALGLMSPQPYPDLYLATLSSSALAHYAAGRFDDSLHLNGQAIDLATRLQMDRFRARGYYGMGVTYYAIGDRELSARFLRSALEIWSPDVDARGRVAALRALAVIEHERGAYAEAAAHNSEALRLATAPSARSRILLHLAADYAAQGDKATAGNLLDSLAEFPPNGDALVQALALTQRAALARKSGELDAARADVQKALRTLRKYEAVTDEFEANVELARIEAAAGKERAALAALDSALALRGEITSQTANPEYRASIAASVRPALDLKIDLLWKRHERLKAAAAAAGPKDPARARFLAEARATVLESLETADGSRGLAFEQIRAQRFADRADPHVADLQRTLATLYRDIADRRFHLATREDRAGPADPTAKALRENISRLRARLGVVSAELARRTAPSDASAPGAAGQWFARVVAESSEKAFIEYWVGHENAYAWTIADGQVNWIRLESSARIDQVARGLHNAMRSYASTPTRTRLEHAAALYTLVFAPLQPYVRKAGDLVIVPDGPLHYVPFGTLRDPSAAKQPWLVQRAAIEIAPALRLLVHEESQRPASWANSRMLLVADPVYSADDPRLSGSASVRNTSGLSLLLRMRSAVDVSKLERLVSSAREAEQIRSLPTLRHVDVLEGLNATRTRLLAQDFTAYRFIHIASHGIIDSEIPQLSALILGAWGRDGPVADQQVRAADLLARTFDAELVVLSACDTALGREIAGEGLIGLQYAALARGARSVVASLWPVPDAIAADVMTDMYRYITTDGYPVARALGAAIRAELARVPSLDPALWGPFAVYVADP